MDTIKIWGEYISRKLLSEENARFLESVPGEIPDVQWIWREMDKAWDSFCLDNARGLGDQPIGDFYGHAVWIANGIFSMADKDSSDHRKAIAAYLSGCSANQVADYGGGFGGLAVAIAAGNPQARVSIVDPYASKVGMERFNDHPQIRFTSGFQPPGYDAVVAQDVLEHIEDPIGAAIRICDAVETGGRAIFANSFEPVIKCHLPCTFHLRHTFPWVMRAIGMQYIGRVPGAPHAQVFLKSGPSLPARGRRAELVSRRLGPWLNLAGNGVRRLKRVLRHLRNSKA